jgi:ATP-dependent Clp protease ATP-binding subunit ClpA
MMMQRLTPDARSLVASAEQEARAQRASHVEAEHLLLAMAATPATDAGRVLATAGLTHESVEAALEAELEASLAVVGVSVDAAALGTPSPHPQRTPRLGASFKASMERSVSSAAGSSRIRPAHLLLGVLGAQQGTVPRSLARAGVDTDELVRLTRQSLTQ